jgi:phytoene dehydrogenase-like protein
MAAARYDAVVIGAGHNGLVAAAYLARAGLSVCVLEQREVLGGATVTEELFPGFHLSTCSYSLSLLRPEIVRDLELARHGLRVAAKDPALFAPQPDGRALVLWRDPARQVEAVAGFSRADAAAWGPFWDQVEAAARVLRPLLLAPPPAPEQVQAAFERLPGGAGYRRFVAGSVAELAASCFESDAVKGYVASQGVIGTAAGPWQPGTAFVFLYHAAGEVTGIPGAWGYVRGGMGSVAAAIAADAREHGAVLRTAAPVERVLVSDGRATGVALASGEEVTARVVLSGAEPKRTLLGLVGAPHLPAGTAAAVAAWPTPGVVLKLNAALAALPDFTALPATPGPAHRGTVGICPSVAYLEAAWQDAAAGRPSAAPFMEVFLQSATEPTLAPPGRHTMSIFAQYAPYRLADGDWDTRRDEIARTVLDTLAGYAPNLDRVLLDYQAAGPPDLERRFGLTGGHIFHGELLPEVSLGRRMPYRSPVAGLYLCGSGTHPGGAVTGAPGHNAARVVLDDLRVGEDAGARARR